MNIFVWARCRAWQALHTKSSRRAGTVPDGEDGPGSFYSIPQLLRSARLSKPLLAVDPVSEPWGSRLGQLFEENDMVCSLYPVSESFPTSSDADRIARTWLADGCDCFVALGGPVLIDAVKLAARAAPGSGKVLEGPGSILQRQPPVFAVPTAAGAGAEVSIRASVADPEGHTFRFVSSSLMPVGSIADPELLAQTPREDLARCVMDGLCLAAEAYLSRTADEKARSLAMRSLQAFFESAEPCWNSGGTLMERSRLLEASRYAGLAANRTGGGYARALAESWSDVCGTAPAEAFGLLLPSVLTQYGEHAASALSELASGTGVLAGGTRTEKARALIDRLQSIAFRFGLPESHDLPDERRVTDIAALASAAANPRWTCPVVWDEKDLAAVFQKAFL